MIKFLLTLGGVLISAVGFLYYLMTNPNFVPQDVNGKYNVLNISFLGSLLFVAIFCISVLIIFSIKQILAKKGEDIRTNIRCSLKYGILLTLGIFVVYILHFFHILGFLWGMAILIVVIVSLFVI